MAARPLFVLVGVAFLARASGLSGQTVETSSLSRSETTVKALEGKIQTLQSALQAMTESTASAHVEAETLRAELAELRQQIDAVGLSGLAGGAALEHKLVAALNDLRLERKRVQDLSDRLLKLTEAAVIASQSLPEGAAKAAFSAIVSEGQQALAKPAVAKMVNQTDSQIVSVSRERNLAVLNTGEGGGLKNGTPIRIFRADRPIAEAIVVQVRSRVSGALISSLTLSTDFPQPGDSVRIEAVKN